MDEASFRLTSFVDEGMRSMGAPLLPARAARRARHFRSASALGSALLSWGCFSFEADRGPVEIGTGGDTSAPNGGGSGASTSQPEDDWCGDGREVGRRLARDIELTQITAYQGVEIRLAVAGGRVQKQNADIVQGRDLLVRGFVRPGPTFVSKVLGARLLLSAGAGAGEPVAYEDLRFVQGESAQAALESTFDFYVPGGEVLPGQRFAVELFEEGPCNAPGVLGAARFPETGASALATRATGGISIVLVPIRYDADGSKRMPDVSPGHVEDMRGLLHAVFPVSFVDLRVRKPVATQEKDFGDVLNQLLQLRALDDPPSDVSYFGLVNMAGTMDEYCQGGCVAGVATFGTPSGSAAAGVGIGFRGPAQETFVHEIGHVHRLLHAPCGGATGPDPEYPYADALLGSWGYDARSALLIDPNAERRDFMSYCDPTWISDYNYQALVERLALVNGRRFSTASSVLADVEGPLESGLVARRRPLSSDALAPDEPPLAESPGVFRTLRSRPRAGLRWGAPLATRREPPGEQEVAEVLDGDGRVLTKVTVYRQELSDEQGALWFVPQPEPAWRALRVRGQAPIAWESPQVRAFDPVE